MGSGAVGGHAPDDRATFPGVLFRERRKHSELVRTGKLDSLLVLPIDSQFAVSHEAIRAGQHCQCGARGIVVCVRCRA